MGFLGWGSYLYAVQYTHPLQLCQGRSRLGRECLSCSAILLVSNLARVPVLQRSPCSFSLSNFKCVPLFQQHDWWGILAQGLCRRWFRSEEFQVLSVSSFPTFLCFQVSLTGSLQFMFPTATLSERSCRLVSAVNVHAVVMWSRVSLQWNARFRKDHKMALLQLATVEDALLALMVFFGFYFFPFLILFVLFWYLLHDTFRRAVVIICVCLCITSHWGCLCLSDCLFLFQAMHNFKLADNAHLRVSFSKSGI